MEYPLALNHLRVLKAKTAEEGTKSGFFVFAKSVFGELAPIWLNSWNRDGSTAEMFNYMKTDYDQIYTRSAIPAERYYDKSSRLDALCMDVFVSILFYVSREKTAEVVIEDKWLLDYLGWKMNYPFYKVKDAVNKLVCNEIYKVNVLVADKTGEKPEPLRLLSGSEKRKGGIKVIVANEFLRDMGKDGFWSVASGADYVSIARSGCMGKSRNQLPKLLYLMLRGCEMKGTSYIDFDNVEPLVEWNKKRKTLQYRRFWKKGRVGKSLRLLQELGIIEKLEVFEARRVLAIKMNPAKKKIEPLPYEQQLKLGFAKSSSALDEE